MKTGKRFQPSAVVHSSCLNAVDQAIKKDDEASYAAGDDLDPGLTPEEKQDILDKRNDLQDRYKPS